jgi:hypothetical protein
MNSWVSVIEWLYILAFVVFGFWFFVWLRDWWRYQRRREALIREARNR